MLIVIIHLISKSVLQNNRNTDYFTYMIAEDDSLDNITVTIDIEGI